MMTTGTEGFPARLSLTLLPPTVSLAANDSANATARTSVKVRD